MEKVLSRKTRNKVTRAPRRRDAYERATDVLISRGVIVARVRAVDDWNVGRRRG